MTNSQNVPVTKPAQQATTTPAAAAETKTRHPDIEDVVFEEEGFEPIEHERPGRIAD